MKKKYFFHLYRELSNEKMKQKLSLNFTYYNHEASGASTKALIVFFIFQSFSYVIVLKFK